MYLSKIYGNFVHLLLLLVLSTTAVGCRYHYVEKPEKLLSPEEMAEVICQVSYLKILDEQGAFEQDTTLMRIGKNAFVKSLYKKYGINSEILRQNNEYYCENNRLYIKIYSDALNRLNTLTGEEEKKKIESTGSNTWTM